MVADSNHYDRYDESTCLQTALLKEVCDGRGSETIRTTSMTNNTVLTINIGAVLAVKPNMVSRYGTGRETILCCELKMSTIGLICKVQSCRILSHFAGSHTSVLVA